MCRFFCFLFNVFPGMLCQKKKKDFAEEQKKPFSGGQQWLGRSVLQTSSIATSRPLGSQTYHARIMPNNKPLSCRHAPLSCAKGRRQTWENLGEAVLHATPPHLLQGNGMLLDGVQCSTPIYFKKLKQGHNRTISGAPALYMLFLDIHSLAVWFQSPNSTGSPPHPGARLCYLGGTFTGAAPQPRPEKHQTSRSSRTHLAPRRRIFPKPGS